MKTVLLLCSVSFIVGIAAVSLLNLAGSTPAWAGGAAFAGAGGLSWLGHRRPPRRRALWAAAAACALAAGGLRGAAALQPPAPGTLASFLHGRRSIGELSFRGRIVREPAVTSDKSVVLCVAVSEYRHRTNAWRRADGERVRLRVFTRARKDGQGIADLAPEIVRPDAYGYRIEAQTFKWTAPTPSAPADTNAPPFDFEAWLLREGYAGQLMAHAGRVTVLEREPGHRVIEAGLALKARMVGGLRRVLWKPCADLAEGAALGIRQAVYGAAYRGRPMKELFQHVGVSHILSVSGMHVSLVAAVSLGMLAWLRVPRRFAAPLVVALAFFYTFMTGAEPPALRAALMTAFAMGVWAFAKKKIADSALIGLCLAALILLWMNPLILFSPSFQLSFGAVLSLILLTGPVERVLCRLDGALLPAAAAWACGMLAAASACMFQLCTWRGLAASVLALVGLLVLARSANRRWPKLTSFGYARLPLAVRGLLAGQGAVLLGILIPLSSWYFGRFSVAGLAVNLAAIPLGDFFIQFALATGLLGCIPGWVGLVASWPTGLIANLLGILFLELGRIGAWLFPYPAAPRPTLLWIAGYYVVVAAATAFVKRRLPPVAEVAARHSEMNIHLSQGPSNP